MTSLVNKQMKVKFVTRISKQGDQLVIIIPKASHSDAKKLKPTQLKITLEDEF